MLAIRDGHSPATMIRRDDYTAPAYWVDSVDLTFDLDPNKTKVLNKMVLRRNQNVEACPLRLDGEELNLARVLVNGQGASFKIESNQLVIENLPEETPFELEIFTTCNPTKNTQLMGLYVSQDSFFTQCEAEGFRRITYYLDRPDVMANFSVVLRADKKKYPVLLSNGNLIKSGELEDGRHYVKWVDPHKKPCYLFALVAGKLVCREQGIKSRSGRSHLLQVYVRPGDMDKTEHAMNSLISSVIWDESRFGLSLDLERFMIVATNDFNMGAMENKGLNIFNTKYVLANQTTATDTDYANIESVVGHEYFHNWTGNRVTCRDWFQLSLKEGLTVFRDQEFSQDLCTNYSARAVKRIEDVRVLRTAQFPEDSGPMAHPVRPESYIEINNFYTVTIYEKGAEVVRMMQTLVGTTPTCTDGGRSNFSRGMKLYFERFDGQAVTCDDFTQAIADANPGSHLFQLLKPFKRWYSQAGTPVIKAHGVYDSLTRTYTLTLSQKFQNGGEKNLPYVIPVGFALFNEEGQQLALHESSNSTSNNFFSTTLVLSEEMQSFVFENILKQPVPSLLRGFSAPVILEYEYKDQDLLILLAHDSDPFNRWEAGQRLALRAALHALSNFGDLQSSVLNVEFIEAMRGILRHSELDAAFKELVLTLPSESYIADQLDVVDPQRIHQVRECMRLELAQALESDWKWAFEFHQDSGAFKPDPHNAGRRALSGMALSQLCLVDGKTIESVWAQTAFERVQFSNNMTDRVNALAALIYTHHSLASAALDYFYAQFQHEDLVLDKWFSLQAASCDRKGEVLSIVKNLKIHSKFYINNPNRARSLLFSFCSANPGAFHRSDGEGYVFWKTCVLELDPINPQVAARLARSMDRWKKLSEPYRSKALAAIELVAAQPNLSNDLREVINRSLIE